MYYCKIRHSSIFSRTRHTRSPSGFTVLELLVVIAIISVLASMLLPGLQKSREKAASITCLNNLKQIGMAIQIYADEYNEQIPSVTDIALVSDDAVFMLAYQDPETWWKEFVYNYSPFSMKFAWAPPPPSGPGTPECEIYNVLLNSNSIELETLWCPSSGQDRKWNGSTPPTSSTPVSYGFNYAGTGNNSGFFAPPVSEGETRKLAQIAKPAELIAVADSYPDSGSEFSIAYGSVSGGPGATHSGGCNVLFADGHAAWHTYDYLFNTIYIWNYDGTNTDH